MKSEFQDKNRDKIMKTSIGLVELFSNGIQYLEFSGYNKIYDRDTLVSLCNTSTYSKFSNHLHRPRRRGLKGVIYEKNLNCKRISSLWKNVPI